MFRLYHLPLDSIEEIGKSAGVVERERSDRAWERQPAQAALQREHHRRFRLLLVVVAEQVTQAVDGQAFQLGAQPAPVGAAASGLDGDDDVTERDAVAGRIALPLQLLKVKTEHVGGAIVLPEVAIEDADLV